MQAGNKDAGELVQVQVCRSDLGRTRLQRCPAPAVQDGQVLVEVEKFALTANNVSYAVSGDMIGYWRFFPAEDPWGVVPVWGFGRVVASRSDALPEGERFWGFLPMATHALLSPSRVTQEGFVDDSPHRRDLPGLYNVYQRTAGDRPPLSQMEDERCALVPLFTTSFVLADWLADNSYFGARQVLVASASSKTGLGLCDLLSRVPGRPVRVVGLTSTANRAFVQSLGTCDEVRTYEEIDAMDGAVASVLVDMAGAARVLRAVHTRFGERLAYSCLVGATHWKDLRGRGALPGPAPQFFFAPAQIAKRDEDWGPGELLRRGLVESLRIAASARGLLEIVRDRGGQACREALDEMIAGRTPPSRARILSLR